MVKRTICLVLVMVLALSFTGCNNYRKIDLDDVINIKVWNNTKDLDRYLTTNEVKEVIELYNNAPYGGKADGSGGTPTFGLVIYHKDGSVIKVAEWPFHGKGHTIEVQGNNISGYGFYLNSLELSDYIGQLS